MQNDHSGVLRPRDARVLLIPYRQEGGSWDVRVSLAAVGQWIRSLGSIDPAIAFGQAKPLPPRSMDDPEVSQFVARINEAKSIHHQEGTPRKVMRAVKHVAVLSGTPVREGEAPMKLDAHHPEWL